VITDALFDHAMAEIGIERAELKEIMESVNRRGDQRHIVTELTAAEFHHLFHHPPPAVRR
jgi:hypothetical protein